MNAHATKNTITAKQHKPESKQAQDPSTQSLLHLQ